MQNARCWGPANFPAVADPTGAIAGFLFQPVTNHRPDGRFMHKHVILGILTAHLVVIDPAFFARVVWIRSLVERSQLQETESISACHGLVTLLERQRRKPTLIGSR